MDPQADSIVAALRLAAIVEGSDDAIISKDVNGIITSWNAAAERMFGHTSAEMVGRSIRTIIPPDRQSEEDMVLGRIRRGERVDHFETERQRKNGERFAVSITVSPIRTPDGRIIGASKIARDISERRRAEQALAVARAEQSELQRRLTAIIDASGGLLLSPRLDDVFPAILNVARGVLPSDGCALWRLDGAGSWRVVASHGLSDAFTSIVLPASAQDAQVVSDLLVVEAVDDVRVLHRRDAYLAEHIESLLVVPLQGGPELNASVSFYYRRPHVFNVVERESARGLGKLASAAVAAAQLYESQRRRRLESDFVAEASSMLVSSLEFRDTLRQVAENAVPLLADWCVFDLVLDEGERESVAAVAVPALDLQAIERFQRAAGSDEETTFSVDRVIRGGVSMLVSRWRADDFADPDRRAAGESLHAVSVMSVPLTAHTRTLGAMTLGSVRLDHAFGPAELRFAEDLAYRTALSIDNILSYDEARSANSLKDEFLANLSHELRTPLNAILGYARMLRKGAMAEDRKARAYDVLDKNAVALTQIVEDVLDISRIVSGKLRLQLQPVDMAPLITQSVDTVQPGAEAKGIRIDVLTDGHVPEVAGDPDRLRQVFWNLLSNAVKFTPRDGRIVVTITGTDQSCNVSVTDNGVGIEPRFLPHVFERFRQGDSRFGREYGGLGLGLAIARQLVEMHGGTIRAESAGLGLGATFRVVLPCLTS